MITVVLVFVSWAGLWLLAVGFEQRRTPRLASLLAPAQPPRSWTETIGATVEKLVSILGVRSGLHDRLASAGDLRTVESFRSRQVISGLAAAAGVGALAAALGAATQVVLGLGLTAALVAVLAHEQLVIERGETRRRRAEQELPVIAEQLSILLTSGSSVGTSLAWLAQRGHGVLAEEIEVCQEQVAHGAEQAAALVALARRVGSERVRRLCLLLSLDHRTTDLGQLVAQEATVQRREGHRQLLTELERRAQQVWIPITLAALIPGSIVLAIPLIDSMRAFSQL